MNLPPGLDFASLFHGENERIPVSSLHFGTTAIHWVLERYGTG
jgi:hypothetical protein